MYVRLEVALLTLAAAIMPPLSRAQWKPEGPGAAVSIESAVLGESRSVSVVLPSGNPPLIVVNIWTMLAWYLDHDLTPTQVRDVPTSGGALPLRGRFR